MEVTIQCAKAVYQFIYYIQFAIIDFVLKSIMFMYLVRVPSSVSFSIFQILYPSFRCKILIPSFVCLFFFFFLWLKIHWPFQYICTCCLLIPSYEMTPSLGSSSEASFLCQLQCGMLCFACHQQPKNITAWHCKKLLIN